MFLVEDRERLRVTLIERARSDDRIVAAAAVGSSAGGGDRWSDLDLTFAVANDQSVDDVLTEWTQTMVSEWEAVVLFDLPAGPIIYRVFLVSGALQVDLSFALASDFGARGPRFDLIFGKADDQPSFPPASPNQRLGLAVHHAVRAHVCIERKLPWQAEYWIHQLRDEALSLACRRLGLVDRYGRGFDLLPADVQDVYARARVTDLRVQTLRQALAIAASGLLVEAEHLSPDTDRLRSMLVEITG